MFKLGYDCEMGGINYANDWGCKNPSRIADTWNTRQSCSSYGLALSPRSEPTTLYGMEEARRICGDELLGKFLASLGESWHLWSFPELYR